MAYETHNTHVAPPTNMDMSSPDWAAYMQRVRANQEAGRVISARNAAKRDGGITKWMPRIANSVIAGATGAGVLPALFGGGTAVATTAAAPTVAGSTVPAAASGGMTLGKILSNPLTTLGVNTVSSIFGARSANKANKYAVDRQSEGLAKQLAMEEARLANEAAELRAQRIEDQRRWEAEEAYKAKVMAASEDERLYARGIADKRQARVDAYDPIRQRALRSVGKILGF